jgi:DNA polymerase-4
MEHYKAVSEEIHRIFHEYTDLIEPLALDEAFLDVTENKKNIPLAVDIARAIKKEIREKLGLVASAGVSYNKFLAKIANRTVFLLSIPVKQLLLSLVCLLKYFGGSVK